MQCSSNGNRALCSRIIDPLSRLPAGQFPPTSHSSSLPPHRRCIVGFSQHKPQLPFDPALTCTDWVILFFCMLSQPQPDSAPLGAAMNTLQRATQWCNTLCSIADEPHTADTAGSRPISVTLVAAILLTDCDSYEKVKMSKHTETFFFLGDSYCFSVSTLLSTEVFTPLSSLTRAWIRWWVCKLRFFFFSSLVCFYAEKSPSEPKCFKTSHRTSTFTRLIGHMCGAGATTENIRI